MSTSSSSNNSGSLVAQQQQQQQEDRLTSPIEALLVDDVAPVVASSGAGGVAPCPPVSHEKKATPSGEVVTQHIPQLQSGASRLAVLVSPSSNQNSNSCLTAPPAMVLTTAGTPTTGTPPSVTINSGPVAGGAVLAVSEGTIHAPQHQQQQLNATGSRLGTDSVLSVSLNSDTGNLQQQVAPLSMQLPPVLTFPPPQASGGQEIHPHRSEQSGSSTPVSQSIIVPPAGGGVTLEGGATPQTPTGSAVSVVILPQGSALQPHPQIGTPVQQYHQLAAPPSHQQVQYSHPQVQPPRMPQPMSGGSGAGGTQHAPVFAVATAPPPPPPSPPQQQQMQLSPAQHQNYQQQQQPILQQVSSQQHQQQQQYPKPEPLPRQLHSPGQQVNYGYRHVPAAFMMDPVFVSSIHPDTAVIQIDGIEPHHICRDHCSGACRRENCNKLHIPPGWLPMARELCNDNKSGKCKRPFCRHFHGTEGERLEFQAFGATIYRPDKVPSILRAEVEQQKYMQQQQFNISGGNSITNNLLQPGQQQVPISYNTSGGMQGVQQQEQQLYQTQAPPVYNQQSLTSQYQMQTVAASNPPQQLFQQPLQQYHHHQSQTQVAVQQQIPTPHQIQYSGWNSQQQSTPTSIDTQVPAQGPWQQHQQQQPAAHQPNHYYSTQQQPPQQHGQTVH